MMLFGEAVLPLEAEPPRPEAEVRERIEQLRFEAICARELRGDLD